MRIGMAGRCLAAAGLVVALGSTAVPGEEVRVEAVESVPVALHRDPEAPGGAPRVDVTIEASGVEPVGDGKLVLVAHDKSEELYVVEAATGRVVGEPVRCDAFPKNPKWEGMARDDKGHYYLVGSHSGKTDEVRMRQSQMIRFRLKGDGSAGKPLTVEPGSVRSWKLGESLGSALSREQADVKKLKIEGLAVYTRPAGPGRPGRTELAVGLRAPTDLVRVFSADISKDPADGTELAFERLFAFPAGDREGYPAQLTSLLYLPAWKGFFVLTATEDDANAFHGNTLWYLPLDAIPSGRGLATPRRLCDFEPAQKAEGLTDLPVPAGADPSRSARLLVTYDNDVHNTHIPSRVQTFRLSRGAR